MADPLEGMKSFGSRLNGNFGKLKISQKKLATIIKSALHYLAGIRYGTCSTIDKFIAGFRSTH